MTRPDPVDVGLLLGLIGLAVGLWLVWPPLALIVPSTVVLVVCGWLALIAGGTGPRRKG